MSLERPTRLAVAVAIAWTGVTVGLFLFFFDHDRTDDYAGWFIAVWGLQLPVYIATVTASRGARFGTARALAVVIPVSLTASGGVFWLGVLAGLQVWPQRFLEFRPLFLGLAVGLIALVAGFVWSLRSVRRRPHPAGFSRVLWLVSITGVLGAAATLVAFGGVGANDAELWIAILAPIAFVVPLWLVRGSHPKTPPPVTEARLHRGQP